MVKIKKSWVWNYLIETGNNAARCIFCNQEFKTGSGTSNLTYHFKNIHKDKISSSIGGVVSILGKHKLEEEEPDRTSLTKSEKAI